MVVLVSVQHSARGAARGTTGLCPAETAGRDLLPGTAALTFLAAELVWELLSKTLCGFQLSIEDAVLAVCAPTSWALPDFDLLLQMSWPSRLPSAKSNPNPSFILYCFKSVSSECPICALAWSKSCSAPVPTPRDLGHRAAGWHQAAVGAGKEPPVVRSYRAAGSCTWQLVQSSGSHKLYVELQNTRRWPKLLVKSCCCSSQRDRAQIPGPGF